MRIVLGAVLLLLLAILILSVLERKRIDRTGWIAISLCAAATLCHAVRHLFMDTFRARLMKSAEPFRTIQYYDRANRVFIAVELAILLAVLILLYVSARKEKREQR